MSNAGLRLLTALEDPEPLAPKKKSRPRNRKKKGSAESSPSTLIAQLNHNTPNRDVTDQEVLHPKSKKNVRIITNSNKQNSPSTSAKSPSAIAVSPLPGSSKNKKNEVVSVLSSPSKNKQKIPNQSQHANESRTIPALFPPAALQQIMSSKSYIPPSMRTKETSTPSVSSKSYLPPSMRTKETSTPSVSSKSYLPPSMRTKETSTPSVSSKVQESAESYNWRSIPSPSQIKDLPLNFHIKRIKNPKFGKFIRVRSTQFKYINLKSFITPNQQTRCEFHTKTASAKLVSSFEKLEVSASAVPPNISKKAQKKKRKKEKAEREKQPFPEYITPDEVNAGLKDGTLVKGFLRINPKNARDAYVSNGDTSMPDYYLTSVLDRNRALDGDEVILRVKAKKDWIDGQKTATVVFIKEKIHPRLCVGLLAPGPRNADYAVFEPRDKRCPLVRIPEASWPNSFKQSPNSYKDIIILVKILRWLVPEYALGIVTECLGQSGDLRVETISILKEFCLDITPFEEDVIRECLPRTLAIPEKESYREDIRKECVFTIDPETAKDLDDAVSVKALENGNYQVGVHISDASFYLEQGTELDQQVCRKATTIYMVTEAFHMLPPELCMFCSLLPGEDKLSFSVFWEMTAEGEILSRRFGRTLMNSCTKLAYEHAQMVIENPDREFTTEDFPKIHGGFGPADIASTIKILQKMAVNLRRKRLDSGALKIDQTKLMFKLDPTTGEPLAFSKYENKEAHRLIEEFMLLANISVAEKIYEHFPELAFLRCHEPPKNTMLVELQNSLASCGIHIDISSSGGLSNSLKKYITDDYAGLCRSVVLNHLTAKAMTRAKYFCASMSESDLDFKHYALSIPIYTHFTSPIRRYADIMVHRLLAASLGYEEPPKWSADYVNSVAANCNGQKYNAKRAGDASTELYLAHYVTNNKPFVEDCVVVEVKERCFDCIVLKTGSVVRIYNNNCEIGSVWTAESIPIQNGSEGGKKPVKVTIKFPKTSRYPEVELIVEIFSIVKICLERKPKSYKLEGILYRPVPTLC